MSDFSELNIILKFIICIHSLQLGGCTIDGISYMDPLKQRDLRAGEDPCNPLYWYPKPIPGYCYIKQTPKSVILPPVSVPMPIPIPVPQQFSIPVLHMGHPPLLPPPMPPPFPSSMMEPPVPLPFGVPLQQPMPPPFPFPPPAFPIPSAPYPFPAAYGGVPYGHGQAGMVPGLPGLVSDDGGINILPFSDVYADVLEKYKQKRVRKRLERILSKYGRRRRYRNWRRHNY